MLAELPEKSIGTIQDAARRFAGPLGGSLKLQWPSTTAKVVPAEQNRCLVGGERRSRRAWTNCRPESLAWISFSNGKDASTTRWNVAGESGHGDLEWGNLNCHREYGRQRIAEHKTM